MKKLISVFILLFLLCSCYYSPPNQVGHWVPSDQQSIDSVTFRISHHYWKGFIASLSDCWYTYETDFVSANIDKPASNVAGDVNIPNTTMTSASAYSNGVMSPSSGQPYVWASNGLVTSAQLQILSRLTRFVNKNSIIGGRIYEYLKVHFGQDTIDAMFRQSNFLGSFVTDVKLDDTYSPS